MIATMLFLVTVIGIAGVLWQQRRAEQMAEVAADDDSDVGPPPPARVGAAPAPGVAGG